MTLFSHVDLFTYIILRLDSTPAKSNGKRQMVWGSLPR